MERGQKLSGLRARAIEASLVVPLIVAACGPDTSAATQKPTTQPTENPTPTIIVTPTPEATPIPTPEITPAPTPEATPIPLGEAFAQIMDKAGQDGWKNVTAQNVTDSINKAYESDSEAAALINPETNTLEKEVVNKIWKNCSTNEDQSVKVLACSGLIGHLYYEGYTLGMKEEWFDAISKVVGYAHTEMVKQDFNSFEAYATAQKPPF